MSKSAPVSHAVDPSIVGRWSPRAFLDRAVEPEKLLSIFEAARWAASSSNRQPWAYLAATKADPAEFAKLLSVLAPLNQVWAQNAPVLLISLAHTVTPEGNPNRHAFHDTGAASALLAVQATALGLQAHQMGGFDVEKTKELFALPPNVEPVAAIAVGYAGDPETLPEKLREREAAPRVRKSLDEFVYTGTYGTTSPLIQ